MDLPIVWQSNCLSRSPSHPVHQFSSPLFLRTQFTVQLHFPYFFANNFSFILLVYFSSVFCFLLLPCTFPARQDVWPKFRSIVGSPLALRSLHFPLQQRLFIRNTVSASRCILFNFLYIYKTV